MHSETRHHGRDHQHHERQSHGRDCHGENSQGGDFHSGREHRHHHGGPHGHGGGHRRGGGGDGERGHGPFGGPRGRARRGEARYVLLDALRDGPKHGYEIIKALEERSGGQYVPSPGTVYPTMQYLEDQGLVRADSGTERRVYHLTEAGQTELEAHADDLADFWGRFAGPTEAAANSAEVGFLRDALDDLTRTVWNGLPGADSPETIGRIRQAVELCQNTVREIIADTGRQAV